MAIPCVLHIPLSHCLPLCRELRHSLYLSNLTSFLYPGGIFIPPALRCFLCFPRSLCFLVCLPSLLPCFLLWFFGLPICSCTCLLLNVISLSSVLHTAFLLMGVLSQNEHFTGKKCAELTLPIYMALLEDLWYLKLYLKL